MAKILIIEDDDTTRTAIRLALHKDGHEIIEAYGLIEFNRHRPSVVITDMIMPGVNGIEVVAEIKRRDPSVRIIAISGDPQMGLESLAPAKKLKADVALVKPFKIGQLRNAMQRFVPACAPRAIEDKMPQVSAEVVVSAQSQPVGPGLSYQFSL
jgi:CheY-like chemotaxis protein